MTVVLEATVDVKPIGARSVDLFIDLYNVNETGALKQHGYEVIGAWKRTGGPVNRITHLYRFESLTQYADLRERARPHSTEPSNAWLEAPITISEVTTLGLTPAWFDDEKLSVALGETPTQPRQYVMVVVQIPVLKLGQAYELIAREVARAEGAGAFQMVVAYQSVHGRVGEHKIIGVLPRDRPDFAYQAGLTDPTGIEVLQELEIYYLNPLPYSRLQ